MTLTASIALYGALLSTYVLLREHWSRRRRAQVRCGYTAVPRSPVVDGNFVLAAAIANTGRESIFIASCAVEAKYRLQMSGGYADGSATLPAELRPSQSLTVYFDARSVASIAAGAPFKLVRPIWRDQLGKRYYGKFIVAGQLRQHATGWELSSDDPPSGLQLLGAYLARRRRTSPRGAIGGAA